MLIPRFAKEFLIRQGRDYRRFSEGPFAAESSFRERVLGLLRPGLS